MGDFSADWLALREPADARGRSADLTARVATRLAAAVAAAQPLAILDLGTGTGSNVRYLAARLPAPQRWCAADRDIDLLRQFTKSMAAWALDRGAVVAGGGGGLSLRGGSLDCRCDTTPVDLARLTDAKGAAVLDRLFSTPNLITASALLDLVSERWLQALVDRCVAARATALFVLTYDGRMHGSPADADDERIRALVNRHQKTAKAFGRALGPDAHATAVRLFTNAGYDVAEAASDWQLAPESAALQRPLIDGWAAAAAEMERRDAGWIEAWRERRLAAIDAGQLHVVVGHRDLAAWPADRDGG